MGSARSVRALYYTRQLKSSPGRHTNMTCVCAGVKIFGGFYWASFEVDCRSYSHIHVCKIFFCLWFDECSRHCGFLEREGHGNAPTPHPWNWNDHSNPYCKQRGVSCSDPTLSYMLCQEHQKSLLDHCKRSEETRHSTISQHLSQCRLTCCDGLRTKENQQIDDLVEDLMIWCCPKDIQIIPNPVAGPCVCNPFYFLLRFPYLLGFGSLSAKEKKRTGPFLLLHCRSRTLSEWWLLQYKRWQINILKSCLCWPSCRSFANKSWRIHTDLHISDKAPGLGKAVDIWREDEQCAQFLSRQ